MATEKTPPIRSTWTPNESVLEGLKQAVRGLRRAELESQALLEPGENPREVYLWRQLAKQLEQYVVMNGG